MREVPVLGAEVQIKYASLGGDEEVRTLPTGQSGASAGACTFSLGDLNPGTNPPPSLAAITVSTVGGLVLLPQEPFSPRWFTR